MYSNTCILKQKAHKEITTIWPKNNHLDEQKLLTKCKDTHQKAVIVFILGTTISLLITIDYEIIFHYKKNATTNTITGFSYGHY